MWRVVRIDRHDEDACLRGPVDLYQVSYMAAYDDTPDILRKPDLAAAKDGA